MHTNTHLHMYIICIHIFIDTSIHVHAYPWLQTLIFGSQKAIQDRLKASRNKGDTDPPTYGHTPYATPNVTLASQRVRHELVAAHTKQFRKTSVVVDLADVICWSSSATLTFHEYITCSYKLYFKQNKLLLTNLSPMYTIESTTFVVC